MKRIIASTLGALMLAASAPALAQDADGTQDIYDFAAMCMAADMLEVRQGATESPEREAGSLKIFELLMAAGQSLGKTEDTMSSDVAGFIAAWEADPALLQSSPPAQVRTTCIDTITQAGG